MLIACNTIYNLAKVIKLGMIKALDLAVCLQVTEQKSTSNCSVRILLQLRGTIFNNIVAKLML